MAAPGLSSQAVETYGDVAIERWQAQPQSGRGSRGPHRPNVCVCISCSDGRALLGMQPFRPSWRALFPRWSA